MIDTDTDTDTDTHTDTEARIDVEAALRDVVSRCDAIAAHERFEADGRFILLDDFLPKPLLDALVGDVERTRDAINRNYVPRQKKGGSVSRFALDRIHACAAEVYRSPALRRFIETIVGETVESCPESDPHTYALYHYSEPGDHIGWHYDTSFYRGRRYTILLGLVSNESCVLDCVLHTRDEGRENETRHYRMPPGGLAIFDGDLLWHRVTPLADHDDERVVLTMEMVTDPSMNPWRRLVSNVKDSVAYFGLRDTFFPGRRSRTG
jgi:hypothetical protein